MKTTIICGQKTEYTIVIPAANAPVEQTAAEELQLYLKKALGAELSICGEGAVVGKAFYIGHTEYAKATGIMGKSEENWIIKMHEENVVLTGGVQDNDRGIIYAVYHFLEDVVGIRWWSVWEEYVPELTELSLDFDFYKEGTPAFAHRKILGYRHMEDFYYDARTRANVVGDDGLEGGVYHESIKRLGGALPLPRPHHVHTIGLYCPAKEYFEAHPDWFAWSDAEGKRVPYAHYCLSNDELCNAVLEKILVYIEEDKVLAAKTGAAIPDFYDISFPDAMGTFCQCYKCREIIEKSGASGYALQFVNKVARAVAKKHPDVMLETLAYALYVEPPKDDTLPEKNVIIRLAQVYADIIHDVHHKGNQWYLRLIKSWSEICKKAGCKFYIWDYMFNLFIDMPLPVFGRLCETFRTFDEYGVSGIFAESERLSTDTWELQQFMLLHLSEDPYADEETLVDDFVTKFYGSAAEYVKAYLQELRRSVEDQQNVSAFCNIESMHFSYLDVTAVKKGMVLLDKALEAVKGDPVFEFRVQYMKSLLGGSLLIKYFDLKRMAEQQGEVFEFDREAVRQMVIAGLKVAQKHPRFSEKEPQLKLASEIEYYSNLVFEGEENAPIPAELSDVNPGDVYQFYFKNSSRHITDRPLYGVSFVDDPDSCLGRAQRMCRAEACDPLEVMALLTTSCRGEYRSGVSIRIRKDDEYVCGVELFKEDIVPDTYHLYKIGSVSGIREAGHVRVDIFGNNFDWLHLSGISSVFPMDACDVYLSIKFAGELYGGSKDVQEAVYLDRAIIVRR